MIATSNAASVVERVAREMEMRESEFQQAREQLKQIIKDIRGRAGEAAHLLARMSQPQIQIIKQDFRGIWSSDQIERLALFGHNVISEWLAMRSKTLPANILRRLPREALDILNNPNSEVELLTSRGVKVRMVHKLSPVELTQIADTKKGILKVEDQAKRLLRPKSHIKESDVEDAEYVVLSADRRSLLAKTKCVTVRIPMKTIRKFVS